MAIKRVVTYPDTVLRERAEPVTDIDGKIQQTLLDHWMAFSGPEAHAIVLLTIPSKRPHLSFQFWGLTKTDH